MTQSLPPHEGNYDRCIAVAALNAGEALGHADEIYEGLESIAKACVAASTEESVCLLAPPAAAVGLRAIYSPIGRRVFDRAVSRALAIDYPNELDDTPVYPPNDKPSSYRLSEPKVKVHIDRGYDDKTGLHHNQSIQAVVAVSVFGHPLPILSSEYGAAALEPSSPNRKRLGLVSKLLVSSIGIPENPDWKRPFVGPSIIDVWLGDETLTLAERINGLVISTRSQNRFRHGYKPVTPQIPENAVVLRWPRKREVHIDLSAGVEEALKASPYKRYDSPPDVF